MSARKQAQDDLIIEAAYLEALANSIHNECVTGKVFEMLDCRSNPSADEVEELQKQLYPDLHQSVGGLVKAYTTMVTSMGRLKGARSKTQVESPHGAKVKSSVKSSHLLKRRKKVSFINTVAVYGVDHGFTEGVSIEFLNGERTGEAYYKQHLNLLEEYRTAESSAADYNFGSIGGEQIHSAPSKVATSMSSNPPAPQPIGLGIRFPNPDITLAVASRIVEHDRDHDHVEHHASITMYPHPLFFGNLNAISSGSASTVSTSNYESSISGGSSGDMHHHPAHSSQSTPPSSLPRTSTESVPFALHTQPSVSDQQDVQQDLNPAASIHPLAGGYTSLIPASPYADEAKAEPRECEGRDSVMSMSDFLQQSQILPRSFQPSTGSYSSQDQSPHIYDSAVHPALRNRLRTYGSTPALRDEWLISLRRRAAETQH